MNNWCVYMIRNLDNGKVYIGKAVDPVARWDQHCRGRGSAPYLRTAIEKYGIESFEFSVIINELTDDDANRMERHFIRDLGTLAKDGRGYNIAEGGQGGNPLAGFSEERMAELSETKRKSQNRPEVRAKKIKAMKETLNRPEVKEKKSQAAKEAHARPEVKATHRQSLRGNQNARGGAYRRNAEYKKNAQKLF